MNFPVATEDALLTHAVPQANEVSKQTVLRERGIMQEERERFVADLKKQASAAEQEAKKQVADTHKRVNKLQAELAVARRSARSREAVLIADRKRADTVSVEC